ncbi:MAG: hypothetical protein OdinLCB4_005170 [Candidatus Odinarchaeum yellowstonii]|uniref:50S ribosomal protein L34e n=1 Tax=Odinarchaeota yellowstonii (strain LCB_4) TaxID=1841599 RepID=A0AAF0IA35_ODILC|nr:MAG: hypothetical protein OdinLCB4_005170 [Candidatus Odinarchaeum yellowstonii]
MAKCSKCGRRLNGVPEKSIVELSKLSKSMKKVSRIFSGNLCHRCVAEMIKASVRRETAL